jgi:UDP-glucose 4-epimerase
MGAIEVAEVVQEAAREEHGIEIDVELVENLCSRKTMFSSSGASYGGD